MTTLHLLIFRNSKLQQRAPNCALVVVSEYQMAREALRCWLLSTEWLIPGRPPVLCLKFTLFPGNLRMMGLQNPRSKCWSVFGVTSLRPRGKGCEDSHAEMPQQTCECRPVIFYILRNKYILKENINMFYVKLYLWFISTWPLQKC